MKDILSRKDAAAYLDMSTDTLDRLRADGAIPASQVSRRLIKYRRHDLDAYIALCQNTPSSKSAPRQTGTSNGSRMDTRDALQLARRMSSKLAQSSRRSA